jgi:hypothetical protein
MHESATQVPSPKAIFLKPFSLARVYHLASLDREAALASLKKTARGAGLWYLAFALGPFYLLYVPSKTIVRNDAAATSALILSHERLFRFGLLAETLGAVVFIGLALALYRLFENVDQHRSRQMLALVLVSAALVLVGVVFNATALTVFRGEGGSAAFDQHAREAIGMLLLRLHGQSNGVNEMFWGLWLLPFGWLVVRSRFLPRWLGYWLFADGICWVVLAVTGFLAPRYNDVLFRVFQPAFLAELGIMLWLLIVGAKENALTVHASAGGLE